jgi:ADP-ribosylglycohydrolase
MTEAESSLTGQLAEELITLRQYSKRSGSGYVLDCFWSAWDAFDAGTSYEEVVVRAIKFGNDTDTTAAVAGGLAGAHFGKQSIPSSWLGGLRGRDIVSPLVERLLAMAPA